jgi:hypothetical protein
LVPRRPGRRRAPRRIGVFRDAGRARVAAWAWTKGKK